MPEETKKPIYLPKKEHWTTLLIKEFHERLFHAGISHMLSQMRYIYWIPQARATVKAVIYHCGVCRKYNGGPYKMPKLADWPKEKISKAAPFTYTGLDYTEPFHVKENKEKKVWICIFTCVTVRAVHLEIVDNTTAEQCLMALRRFISRRNTPHTIILDNTPQFKLTKTRVDKAWQQSITHENMQRFTSDAGMKWKFIIEFSPWMGGFYERLVGMVKSSLRKAIQRKFLTTTQFRTYATESEHILNSRPLVYNEFWKHWYNHYLLSLRKRYQTRLQEPRIKSRMNPMVGQIVHNKEDAPRSKWRMGKIVQLIESRDNEIRAASVLLPNGNTIKRPINLLYPLETAAADTISQIVEGNCQKERRLNNISVEGKSKRKASSFAKNRLKALFNEEIGTFVWCRECHKYREIEHVIKD